MKLQLGANKASLNSDFIQVQNNSASALAQGAPAIFEMDGVDDGYSVENASDSTAGKATSFLAGVRSQLALPAGDIGQIQIRGFISNLKLIRSTRAATTDSYATSPAIAIGQDLLVDTVGNGFGAGAAGAATAELPGMVAIGTLASSVSTASTTSDSSLQLTASISAYLRIM